MMEFQRMKILFANLCCFILFTVCIYESQKHNIENISNEDVKIVINNKIYKDILFKEVSSRCLWPDNHRRPSVLSIEVNWKDLIGGKCSLKGGFD